MNTIRRSLINKHTGMVGALLIAGASSTVSAGVIDPDIFILGSVSMDGNTTVPQGTGSQGVSYDAILNGLNQPSLICPANCNFGDTNTAGYMNVQLAHTGDGVGAVTNVNGSGTFAFNEFFLNDYSIDLVNNSLTDTYKITLKIDYSHDASVTADGAAKTTLDVDVEMPGPPSNQLFSSGNLDTTLSMPGPFSDSGSIMFDITLLPGEAGMVEARQDIEGIAAGGSYDINQDMFISVYSVQNLTVPVPAAVWLFTSGLLGLIGISRRQNHVI